MPRKSKTVPGYGQLAKLDLQYMAICIEHPLQQRRRQFHKKPEGAVEEAKARIIASARQQMKGRYAIVKVLSIVEPTTPSISVRPAALGDNLPAYSQQATTIKDLEAWPRDPHPMCRNVLNITTPALDKMAKGMLAEVIKKKPVRR